MRQREEQNQELSKKDYNKYHFKVHVHVMILLMYICVGESVRNMRQSYERLRDQKRTHFKNLTQ